MISIFFFFHYKKEKRKWSTLFLFHLLLQVAAKSGVYDILDNLMINDYETPTWDKYATRRNRWRFNSRKITPHYEHLA